MRYNAETFSKVSNDNTRILSEKYESTNLITNKLKSEIESLRSKILTITEEKDAEIRKHRKLQNEKDELNKIILKLKEEKKLVNIQTQRQIANLTAESQSLHNNSMKIRQKESEKLEKEIANHIETKNALLKTENKLNIAETNIERLKESIKENEEQRNELEDIIKDTNDKTKNLESKITGTERKLKEILER